MVSPSKYSPSSQMHFSILLCHTSMHCWKDSSGMPLSSILTPSWWPPCLQNGSLWWSPWVCGKEKGHTEQDQVNREVVPARWCSSQPGTAGCSERCEQVHCHGEAAMICPATTLVSSCALSEAKAAGSPCRLADWSSGPVARTHCGRCLWHRRIWSTWLWLLILTVSVAFFSLCDIRDFYWQLWHLVSRLYSKIHISSPLMTLRSKSGSVWRQWCPDTPACGASSDHHSAALAPFLRRLSAWEEV